MALEDSKRVKAFRRGLVATVPRFPNNKASLQAMEGKSLTDQLIVYIGWRLRFVGQRPRRITGRSTLIGDSRAALLKPNIDAFLSAVEAGNDLTPYLSLEPRTQGYTPAAEAQRPIGNSWADKDFLLNVMGLHHFHLGLTMEAAGHASRTNEVLFAVVTRDEFEVLGLFDHDAFEHLADGTMTPERTKLWQEYEAREAVGALPGQLMLGGYRNLGITLSSQPVAVTVAAQRHVQIMREIEPKLDDPSFLKTIYPDGKVPARPKLQWTYNHNHLDFGVSDEAAGFFGVYERGPN